MSRQEQPSRERVDRIWSEDVARARGVRSAKEVATICELCTCTSAGLYRAVERQGCCSEAFGVEILRGNRIKISQSTCKGTLTLILKSKSERRFKSWSTPNERSRM